MRRFVGVRLGARATAPVAPRAAPVGNLEAAAAVTTSSRGLRPGACGLRMRPGRGRADAGRSLEPVEVES